MRVSGVFSRNDYRLDTNLSSDQIIEEVKSRLQSVIENKLTLGPVAFRLSDETPAHVELDFSEIEVTFDFDRFEVRK